MARNQARLKCTMWNDHDWREVPDDAQRVYMLILGQSRLSLAGCIDLLPERWADMSPAATPASIRSNLNDLQAHRLIVCDPETHELVVRSFPKNDVAEGGLNGNIIKGFWSAWETIMSAALRKVVVDNVPSVIWDFTSKTGAVKHPASALELASEPPFEPPSEPPFSEPPFEPRSEPTSTVYRLPSPSSSPVPEVVPASVSGDSDSGDERASGTRQERGDAALRLFGNRQADKAMNVPGQVKSNPERYRQSCIDGAVGEHGPRAHQLAHEHPTWTVERIADELGRRANAGDDWANPKAMYESQDRAYRERRAADEPAACRATVDNAATEARARLAATNPAPIGFALPTGPHDEGEDRHG